MKNCVKGTVIERDKRDTTKKLYELSRIPAQEKEKSIKYILGSTRKTLNMNQSLDDGYFLGGIMALRLCRLMLLFWGDTG